MFKKCAKYFICFVMLSVSMFVFSACNTKDEVKKSEQEEIYSLYVQYMAARGETPLTYEQWLVTVKGEKGEPGKDGVSPKVRINSTTNYWEISIDNGLTWTSTEVKATGQSGHTPVITIGNNGNWFVDGVDTSVNAQGEKGDSAIAPQVRINEITNEWEVSTDNGVTWSSTGVKATGNNGENASYEEYSVVFDYKGFKLIFDEVSEYTTVKSTQWIKDLPQVKEDYNDVFLGWFIKNTDKQVNNFDFIGDNVVLEARFTGEPNEIIDTVSPIITLVGDYVIYLEVGQTQYVEMGATAIDDKEGDISDEIVVTGNVDINKLGTYYIKYDVVDSRGNMSSSVYRQVIVRDTFVPTIMLNGSSDITLNCGGEYIEYGAVAIDGYDGEVEVFINNPVDTSKVGNYVVTYIAIDSSGNRGVAIRNVTVIDASIPVITLIGDEIMYVEFNGFFVDEGALVVDNVDGTFMMKATNFYYLNENDEYVLVDKVDTSKLGTYYAYYDYRDSTGNEAISQIRRVIVRDSISPKITLLGQSQVVLRYGEEYVEYGYVVSDNYDNEVEVTITGEIGDELGTYYLYYDAVDSHGNVAESVIREVIILDFENPIIYFTNECPQYITIEVMDEEYDLRCNEAGYGVVVDDDYIFDLETLLKRIVVTGEVDNTKLGTYVIAYDVTDMSGNKAVTMYRYVSVIDTIVPQITLNGNKEIILGVGEEYEELGAKAVDAYDGEVQTFIDGLINTSKIGTYEITYFAVDSAGNIGVATRVVHVVDMNLPEIVLIGDEVIYLEVKSSTYIEMGAKVIDSEEGDISNKLRMTANFNINEVGTYYIYYDAQDSCGNEAIRKIRTIIVRDTTPPAIMLIGGDEILLRYGEEYVEQGALAMDLYDGQVEVEIDATNLGEGIGSYEIYYTARDISGNSTIVIRKVIVADVEAPIIYFTGECPQYITIEVMSEEYDARCDTHGYGFLVMDNYTPGLEEIQRSVVITGKVDNTKIGLYRIEYDVKDTALNSAVLLTRYVNVVDTIGPVITLNGDSEITINVGDQYVELGAIAVDGYDGVIGVTIDASELKNEVGEYEVFYIAVDSSYNKTQIARKVIVVDNNA